MKRIDDLNTVLKGKQMVYGPRCLSLSIARDDVFVYSIERRFVRIEYEDLATR